MCRSRHLRLLLLTFCFSSIVSAQPPGVRTIEDLDRRAVLHFAIVSDHKGDSPLSSVEFARMTEWVAAGEAAFVVGLGDHLKHGWENSFIPWIAGNRWWQEHFYPNVADGENEYYSPTHKQSDYGTGGPILDLVDLDAAARVVRPNAYEYYARIPAGDHTVHLIQLHYSDQPADPDSALRESSRQWMVEVLEGIDRGDRDLVLVAAHSRRGSWDQVLSQERRRLLLDQADLVLSATTHHHESWTPEGADDVRAVCVNTGAVNYPGQMTPNGYVEVHVLANGDVVGQYMDLTIPQRRLQSGRFGWIKPQAGPLRHFAETTPEVLATLTDSVSAANLEGELTRIMGELTGADVSVAWVRRGLPAGPITLEDAWRVFDKNRAIRVVRVPADRAEMVLEKLERRATVEEEVLRLAVPHPATGEILRWATIDHRAIETLSTDEAGLREVDLVLKWLETR